MDSPLVADLVERIERNGGRILSTSHVGAPSGRTPDRSELRSLDAMAAALTGSIIMTDALTPEGNIYQDAEKIQGYIDGPSRVCAVSEGQQAATDFLDRVMLLSSSEREQGAAEAAAMTMKEEKEWYPRKMSFPVVHYGSRLFFGVDDNCPEVRDAVRKAYGPDAAFVSRNDAKHLVSTLRRGVVEDAENGIRIPMLTDFDLASTRLLHREPFVEYMVFHKDGESAAISPVTQAPEDALPTGVELRSSQARLFDYLAAGVSAQLAELKQGSGIPDERSVAYATAFYATVSPSQITFYKGADSIATISLGYDGQIYVHNDVKGFLPSEKGRLRSRVFDPGKKEWIQDDKSADILLSRCREWLLGKGPDISDRFNRVGRDGQEDALEPYKNGIIEERPDNRDVAAKDIEDAVKAKTILTDANTSEARACDRVEAVAFLLRRRDALSARVNDARLDLDALKERRDTLKELSDEAFATGSSVIKQRAAQESFNKAVQEVNEAKDKLGRLLREQAWAGNDLRLVVSAAAPQEVERAEGHILVNVSNRPVSIPCCGQPLSEEEKKASQEYIKQAAKVKEPALKTVKKISDDLLVIRSENGKMALADASKKVLSNWYEAIAPQSGSDWVRIEREAAGKTQASLLHLPDMRELGMWFDGVGAPSEGFAIVKKDGQFNHVDLSKSGKEALLSESWSAAAADFKNGFARIMAGDEDVKYQRMATGEDIVGKYNFLTTSGDLVSEKWFAAAADFKKTSKGLTAQVSFDGKAYSIDTEGKLTQASKSRTPGNEDGGLGGPH